MLAGAVLSIPLLFACFLAAGFGHGTYLPAIGLFPFGMLVAAMQDYITVFSLGLAFVQFPAYGFLIGSKRNQRVLLILAATHVGTAIAAAAVGRNLFF
jgi:hypothetical protein